MLIVPCEDQGPGLLSWLAAALPCFASGSVLDRGKEEPLAVEHTPSGGSPSPQQDPVAGPSLCQVYSPTALLSGQHNALVFTSPFQVPFQLDHLPLVTSSGILLVLIGDTCISVYNT